MQSIRSAAHTGGNHGLDEVAHVAQYNAEALHRVRLARLGLHRLDLHALQDGMLDEAAAGLEDAPAAGQRVHSTSVLGYPPDGALCDCLLCHAEGWISDGRVVVFCEGGVASQKSNRRVEHRTRRKTR